MTELITFTAWSTPGRAGDPPADSDWSRLAWLPVVGPTSWLMWTTVAAQLGRDVMVTWELDELARAHGVRAAAAARTLDRLAGFQRLITAQGEDDYLVSVTAPPLPASLTRKAPAWIRGLQAQVFGGAERSATG